MTDERVEILREDDPRAVELQASGWTLVATSWGARFEHTEARRAHLESLAVVPPGWRLAELSADDAAEIVNLDRACAADYPQQASTLHTVPDQEELAGQLKRRERRAFAALCTSGSLQAVTVTQELADRIETEFTCVFPAKRGRGLGSAVKAFSILAHAAEGHTLFGTGGASVNAASLGANRRVGYEVEPLWLTLAPPVIGQEKALAQGSEH